MFTAIKPSLRIDLQMHVHVLVVARARRRLLGAG